MTFHLAQINVARMIAPVDDPVMQPFVDQLDAVNAEADKAPGFVWRLIGESGSSVDIRAFDDPLMLVNMSVWETVEQFKDYVYSGGHLSVYLKRKEWFERRNGPSYAMWWIEEGTLPTIQEGKKRLESLSREGPTPYAFDFKQVFEAVNEQNQE